MGALIGTAVVYLAGVVSMSVGIGSLTGHIFDFANQKQENELRKQIYESWKNSQDANE